MRYSSVVTREDAKEAVRLLKVATQAAATDPRTGRIDMDMINTGRSTVDREMGENLYSSLKEFLSEVSSRGVVRRHCCAFSFQLSDIWVICLQRRGIRMGVKEVSRQMGEISDQTISHDDLLTALKRLEADGFIQFNERSQFVLVRSGIVS